MKLKHLVFLFTLLPILGIGTFMFLPFFRSYTIVRIADETMTPYLMARSLHIVKKLHPSQQEEIQVGDFVMYSYQTSNEAEKAILDRNRFYGVVSTVDSGDIFVRKTGSMLTEGARRERKMDDTILLGKIVLCVYLCNGGAKAPPTLFHYD